MIGHNSKSQAIDVKDAGEKLKSLTDPDPSMLKVLTRNRIIPKQESSRSTTLPVGASLELPPGQSRRNKLTEARQSPKTKSTQL